MRVISQINKVGARTAKLVFFTERVILQPQMMYFCGASGT